MKAVSDVIAPLSGEVLEVNAGGRRRAGDGERGPYGAGWLVRIRMSDPSEAEGCSTPTAYKQVLADQ